MFRSLFLSPGRLALTLILRKRIRLNAEKFHFYTREMRYIFVFLFSICHWAAAGTRRHTRFVFTLYIIYTNVYVTFSWLQVSSKTFSTRHDDLFGN